MASDAPLIAIELTPGVGAGGVTLGMTLEQVVAVMGEPERRLRDWLGVGAQLSWHRSSFQVHFGGDGTAGEIELSAHGPLRATVHGIDVLYTPAADVIGALSSFGAGSFEENGHSYSFPEHRFGFWRESHPEEDRDDDEVVDDDDRRGLFWDTVITWDDHYVAEIDAAVAARKKT
jgi:hypothetical protein